MAEVVAVAAAASAFQALFRGLLDLVAVFRTAVKDVETAPRNIKELADEVANASTILESLENVEGYEALLTRPMTAIGEDLRLALEVVQNDAQRKKNGQVVEMAKALFHQGASKQNKRSKEIRDRIREHKVDLSHALDVVALLRDRPGHQTTDQPLAAMLDILENDEHSCWESVYFETDPEHTSFFPNPTKIKEGLGAGSTRGTREGGYEVRNSTKLWFNINYDGHAYFYIVVYDKSLNDAPELLFPKKPKKHNNELQRSLERVFPDNVKYSGDPLSIKLERADRTDGTLTKHWELWVYLILCDEPLHTASTPVLKMEDLVPELLKRMPPQSMEEEEEDKFIAVKRYIFDIK